MKVLTLVGHEPLVPTMERQVCQLPGLFCYAQHIASTDENHKLFTSLTTKLSSGVLGMVVHGKVPQHYQESDKIKELGPRNLQKEATSSFDQVIKETAREMIT